MTVGWHLEGDSAPLTGAQAADLVRQRLDQGTLTTWLENSTGPILAVVTNRSRAMLMLLDKPGDAGVHAIDPTATGKQDGYILENGQEDTYPNHDTIPLDQALRAVTHIVDHGRPPADLAWQSDR